ncbi:MAG: hypothetical protein KKA60_04640 [Proteobacteria bacterium]|nr:hypothetical protein [Pseudomonadota bacterium]
MVTWTPQFQPPETSGLESERFTAPGHSLVKASSAHRFAQYARSRFYSLFLSCVPSGKLAPYQKVTMRRKLKRLALPTGLVVALVLYAFDALNMGLGL